MNNLDSTTIENASIVALETELIRAHTETRQAEERFSLLVESVTDYAIFLLGENGHVESWNSGAEKIKGYSASQIIGRHFSVFYLREDVARNHPDEELRIARRTGRYEEEGWRVRKDGSRFWASVVITALWDRSRRPAGFAKVTRDLSERRAAEDARSEVEEKLRLTLEELEKRVGQRTLDLEEANRKLQAAVQTREEFMSIASHELRTPLTALRLQLQSFVLHLRNGTLMELPEERRNRMTVITEKAVTRLGGLVDNLLDISHISAGKFTLNLESVDLGDLVRDVIERHRDELNAVGVEFVGDATFAVVGLFDRLRVEQVLTNLLSNAIKYGRKKPIRVGLRVAPDGARVTLWVQDQGGGISTADQRRVFERFERASEDRSIAGLGLGLYISRQIVEAHGGAIELESELERGSTFLSHFPLGERASITDRGST